eukprot:390495_1
MAEEKYEIPKQVGSAHSAYSAFFEAIQGDYSKCIEEIKLEHNKYQFSFQRAWKEGAVIGLPLGIALGLCSGATAISGGAAAILIAPFAFATKKVNDKHKMTKVYLIHGHNRVCLCQSSNHNAYGIQVRTGHKFDRKTLQAVAQHASNICYRANLSNKQLEKIYEKEHYLDASHDDSGVQFKVGNIGNVSCWSLHTHGAMRKDCTDYWDTKKDWFDYAVFTGGFVAKAVKFDVKLFANKT